MKVTKRHGDECKKLLDLMGIPYVEVRHCHLIISDGGKGSGLGE